MLNRNRLSIWAFAGTTAMLAGMASAQTGANLCASANLIGPGVYTGTTTAATTDGSTTCAGTSRDVWFRYVNAGNAAVSMTADTCANSNFDTVVSLHSACGAAGTEMGCSDDTCGFSSSVTTNVAAGAQVWIRIAGYGSASGSYTLTVSVGPPAVLTSGPDVTVVNNIDMSSYGDNLAGTIRAFAIGTESCNRGDAPVAWFSNDNQHPVIAQNLYRYKDGRFEQLGQSWVKHGFASVNGDSCGTCRQPPQGGAQLGVSCSDPYGSGLNGNYSGVGPRSIVNGTTGFYPLNTLEGTGTGENSISERCLVPRADVTGAGIVGARFFGETHYVTADDAQWVVPDATIAVNGLNNMSYIEVSGSSLAQANQTFVGATVQQQPAITKWRDIDPTVTLLTADHDDTPNPSPTFPGTFIRSRFYVGGKVSALPGGLYRYEYAVYNVNSDRSAGSFSVPMPSAAIPTSYFFRSPLSHSGEPYSNAPWTMVNNGGRLTFSTSDFATNPNANAIRWGTMYNFGFTSPVAPATGAASIGLFRPGAIASIEVPGMPVPATPPCPADFNGDGTLNADDLGDFITCYFTVPPCAAAEFNADGTVNADDLGDFITAYFAGC